MRKVIAFACMMYAALGVSAQFVDVTTIDVQTETNKVKVIQKEKPIDETIRPEGFIGSVGYEMEIIPVLVRPDNFVKLENAALLQGLCLELGYQIAPQLGLTAELTFGRGKEPIVDYLGSFASKEGILLNSYYYFSPRLADGLYIGAGVGYVGREVFDFSATEEWEDKNPQGYINGRCSWSSPVLKAKAGYAWKYLKVEANFELMSLHYWYQSKGEYMKHEESRLEAICGLKASCYFNAGYIKLRKKN